MHTSVGARCYASFQKGILFEILINYGDKKWGEGGERGGGGGPIDHWPSESKKEKNRGKVNRDSQGTHGSNYGLCYQICCGVFLLILWPRPQHGRKNEREWGCWMEWRDQGGDCDAATGGEQTEECAGGW